MGGVGDAFSGLGDAVGSAVGGVGDGLAGLLEATASRVGSVFGSMGPVWLAAAVVAIVLGWILLRR